MVKPLTFKGDAKPRKRKRDGNRDGNRDDGGGDGQPQRADDGGAVAGAVANDDSWVSADAAGDVAGPVMLLLPAEEPAALACDASGAVFALAVENMVEGNAATAEPHDVRQVWVASRVAGSGGFRFKGHHGRYLSCDARGALTAAAEAAGAPESFAVAAASPGAFTLRAPPGTYVTAAARADAADPPPAPLRIRMQARFKPRLRASRAEQALARVSRRELHEAAGRRLTEDEVRVLKRARREGDYHEKLLELKVKGKHDKFA